MQLWLFIVASLLLFRCILLASFQSQAGAYTLADLFAVLLTGLRFDLSTAGIWILPTFLLAPLALLLPVGKLLDVLRAWIGRVYVVLAMLVFGADLVYFDEYNDQFNQFIFGLVHDDTRAILITIWNSYHPLLVLGGWLVASTAGLWLLRRWMEQTPAALRPLTHERRWPARVALGVLVFLFVAAMARGGTLWGEPILIKHAFVVDDLVLNRMVINPFTALNTTVENKLRTETGNGVESFWPGGDLRQALATVTGQPLPAGPVDLDAALTRQARGAAQPPRHIFLILIESHSGWTVLPQYRHIGLSPALSDLAERGLYFPNFVHTASGTIGAVNALVAGLPDVGLNINHETGSLKPYPSAIAETFGRLGYRTRFFYGGFLGWQRLDSFAQAQGFDELWGGGSMSRDGAPTNEWGVNDRYLFDFVLKTVQDDRPSFNLILTTTNHPPYDLDLEAEGFPVQSLPEAIQQTKSESLKVLGHLWYTDRETGRFVAEAERRLPAALFAITGDHTARLGLRFPGDSVFEQLAVPFILYGDAVSGRTGTLPVAGSHIDIPATLVELAAPAGFPYTAFGENLLGKSAPSFGLGYGFVLGEGFIATDSDQPAFYTLPGGERPEAVSISEPRQRFRALRALGWHRVRNGATLP